MSEWRGRIFALFLSLAVLCPQAAYSEGDDFVPPGQYQQEATNQQISGIKELVFGDDPIAAYAVLTYFTIQRLFALKDLFTQVPTAIKSAVELAQYRKLRKEFLEHWRKTEALKKEQPALFHELQSALHLHGDRLSAVQSTVDELKKNKSFEKNPLWKKDLTRAMHSWHVEGDLTRLDEWLERYEYDPRFIKAVGKSWLKRYKSAREYEELSSHDVVLSAQQITEHMNEMLPMGERSALVTHKDQLGRHLPGAFFHHGNKGPVRLTEKTLVKNMKEHCDVGFAFLKQENADKALAGSRFSPVRDVGMIAIPVFTVGSAAVLTALSARVYFLSWKKYGTDPSSAQRKVRHERNVADSVTAAGETSFSGQVAKRPDSVSALLDPLADVIYEHREEILTKAKEMHELKHSVQIDFEDKAKMLADKDAIKAELSKHLSASRELISNELTLNQFLVYMNRAPNLLRYRGETTEFVNDLYTRALDGMFKELKFKTSVGGQIVPVTFGSFGTDDGRDEWVKQAVPGLQGLKLPAPENTPSHPSIPPKPEPKPETKRDPASEKDKGVTSVEGSNSTNLKKPQAPGESQNESSGQAATHISGKVQIEDGPEFPGNL